MSRPLTEVSRPRGSRCRPILPPDARPRDLFHVKPNDPHWPLVIMTVLTQLSVGAFASIWLAQMFGAATRLGVAAVTSFAIAALALAASTLHLGRPIHAYRALKMWRRSWLSREVLLFTRLRRRRQRVRGRVVARSAGQPRVRRDHARGGCRRRGGQRLHLPRAGAAGVEHAG